MSLKKVTQRSERLKLALDALIAQDLAKKVATSSPIDAKFTV
jgi:hypothetical protein